MEESFLLIFFLILFQSLCLELEKNENINEFYLKGEMNRTNYTIKLNETSKLINSNGTYIYFVELPKEVEAKNYISTR